MESKNTARTLVTPNSQKVAPSNNELYFMTIKELIDTTKPKQQTIVKTARTMQKQLQTEQSSLSGYKPPPQKEQRRSLKNYFAMSFMHTSDHFKKEKQLLAITNPVALAKQKKIEELDRKTMEKRREQRVLKNRVMFKES